METHHEEYLMELSVLSGGKIYVDWINLPVVTGSEESSWGLIKGKYRFSEQKDFRS